MTAADPSSVSDRDLVLTRVIDALSRAERRR